MTSYDLGRIALALVANGKGILAADETVPTLTKRFDTLRIQSTAQSRCAYREMLFTSPGAAEFISGVIMYDETIRQKNTGGTPLAEVLRAQSIFPGIKVDTGAKPLAGSLTRPSRRDSTACGTGSRSTEPWVPASRSGEQSSAQQIRCQVRPA
jgi:fructose-bisphosphate aldolase class I